MWGNIGHAPDIDFFFVLLLKLSCVERSFCGIRPVGNLLVCHWFPGAAKIIFRVGISTLRTGMIRRSDMPRSLNIFWPETEWPADKRIRMLNKEGIE